MPPRSPTRVGGRGPRGGGGFIDPAVSVAASTATVDVGRQADDVITTIDRVSWEYRRNHGNRAKRERRGLKSLCLNVT